MTTSKQSPEGAQKQCGPCSRGQHGCCDGNEYVRCDCHGPAFKVETAGPSGANGGE